MKLVGLTGRQLERRLSPLGESGLKSLHDLREKSPYVSLPARGEWIEMCPLLVLIFISASLPARGEWIEIGALGSVLSVGSGLSPLGESGLKLHGNGGNASRVGSLPMRGEWIEILHPAERAKKEVTSLPARGEWIEILLWL